MKIYPMAAAALLALCACSQESPAPQDAAASAAASEAAAPAEAASAPAAASEAAPAPASEPAAASAAPAQESKPAETAPQPEAAAVKADGKAVFEANCKLCHGIDMPGVPKVGDKAAWAARIKEGQDVLHKHAIEGFNAMPAKGGNTSLSDDEVKAAVDYMAKESGAKF